MIKNPVLVRNFETLQGAGAVVTLEGVAWKAFFFLLFVIVAAFGSWHHPEIFVSHHGTLAFATLGVGLVCGFFPDFAVVLAPVYCVLEGFLIGAYSMIMELMYPGIVLQAVSCTFGIAIACSFLYANGFVKVNSTFIKVTAIFSLGVAIVYIADLILFFGFGTRVPLLHENTWQGILLSLVIIGIAIAHLFVDFERINVAHEACVDEKYECYLAFGVVLTLLWLYLEVLRVLGKGRSRK